MARSVGLALGLGSLLGPATTLVIRTDSASGIMVSGDVGMTLIWNVYLPYISPWVSIYRVARAAALSVEVRFSEAVTRAYIRFGLGTRASDAEEGCIWSIAGRGILLCPHNMCVHHVSTHLVAYYALISCVSTMSSTPWHIMPS